jgi:hypothetical protein
LEGSQPASEAVQQLEQSACLCQQVGGFRSGTVKDEFTICAFEGQEVYSTLSWIWLPLSCKPLVDFFVQDVIIFFHLLGWLLPFSAGVFNLKHKRPFTIMHGTVFSLRACIKTQQKATPLSHGLLRYRSIIAVLFAGEKVDSVTELCQKLIIFVLQIYILVHFSLLRPVSCRDC